MRRASQKQMTTCEKRRRYDYRHERIRHCDDTRRPCDDDNTISYSGDDGIESLPADILCNILERVPMRTIYRSRMVSKFWNASIGDRNWSHVWNKEGPWVIVSEGSTFKLWYSASDEEEPWHHGLEFPKAGGIRPYLCASSGGLTLHHSPGREMRESGFYVGNPLTNQLRFVAYPWYPILTMPDLRDASGTYKLIAYEGKGLRVFDSATGNWDFHATDEKFLQQGLPGCQAAASSSSDKSLAFFVKQFEFDFALSTCPNLKDLPERKWRGTHWPPGHNFDYNGRCIICNLRIENEHELAMEVAEFHADKKTHTLLGRTVLVSGWSWSKARFIVSCAQGLVAAWPWDPNVCVAPAVFDVASKTWKRFRVGSRVISIFKPNPLARV